MRSGYDHRPRYAPTLLVSEKQQPPFLFFFQGFCAWVFQIYAFFSVRYDPNFRAVMTQCKCESRVNQSNEFVDPVCISRLHDFVFPLLSCCFSFANFFCADGWFGRQGFYPISYTKERLAAHLAEAPPGIHLSTWKQVGLLILLILLILTHSFLLFPRV